MALRGHLCTHVLLSNTRYHWRHSVPTLLCLPRTHKSTLVNDSVTTLRQDENLGPKISSKHPEVDLTFSNYREAFRSKTMSELFRGLFVFQLCSVDFLVDHNKQLLKWARSVLGKTLFKKLMKATFYGHFVAGEDQVAIRPLVSRNRQFGVKSILDYSVEEDISTEQAKKSEMESCVPAKTTDSYRKDPERKRFHAYEEFGDRREGVVSSRTYFYEGEEQCDKNMKIFLDSIDGVSGATDKTGFCAIKLTALGRPQLLMQLSEVLMSMRGFFDKMLSSVGDLAVSKLREEQFLHALETLGIRISRDDSRMWFSILDITKDGEVDFLDWDNLLEDHFNLTKLFAVPEIKTKGPVTKLVSTLSEEQEQEMKNMLHRINTIAEYAKEKDVRVMVDAEQTYFQPAISRLTMEMMRKFNKEKAIIFNTYQCYLKQANYNMKVDLDLSVREDFYFGAKLVRGAYMEQERERAKKIGYEDPIHPTIEATTAMYFRCVEDAMKLIKQREPGKIAIMIASHNEETVRYAVEKMKEYNILPSDRVICFGQLLGMCDQISFPLGQAGYSVYKYVPYGPVEEVLPYLSRRAMENRGVLKKVKKEKQLLRAEIWRRIKAGDWFYKPTPNTV